MTSEQTWRALVTRVLAERKHNPGYTARVRRGLSPATETWAYGDVLPFTTEAATSKAGGLSTEERALLRAAALIAAHHKVPQSPGTNRTLGSSMLQLSRDLAMDRDFSVNPDRPDLVVMRLRSLPGLDLDEAANTFNRLLTMAADTTVTIDYYTLTKRLLRWGDGVSPQSRKIREATLAEYYRAVPTLFTRKQPAASAKNPNQTI